MEPPTPPTSDDRAAEANRLYWTTDRSVGPIAQDLGISKGTLYALLQPLPAGLPCPECTQEMVYANRTARKSKLLACPACGLVENETLIREAWREAARNSPTGSVVVRSRAAASAAGGLTAPIPTGRKQILGAALLGTAAAVLLVLWTRKR